MIKAALIILLTLISGMQDYQKHVVSDHNNYSIEVRHYVPPFSGAPTIIIIHDFGGSQDRWYDIAPKLQKLGFSVVLFDLKGHDDDEQIPYYRFANWKIGDLKRDLELAVSFSRQRSDGKIFLLGTGLGANLAMAVGGDDEEIHKVVAISPGLNYRGIQLKREMTETLTDRLMLMASKEDVYSVQSINVFTRNSEKKPETHLYTMGGHGVWLLKRIPESLATVARWLSEEK